MVHPVQNTSRTNPINSNFYIPRNKPFNPTLQDRLQMGNQAKTPSFLSRIWDTIVSCFKTLFSCCFKQQAAQPLIEKIKEIANRDHFIWFYKKEENPLTASFGNFHPCKIQFMGYEFNCAEAVFQAAKFADQPQLISQFQHLHGDAAWRLGRQLSQNWTRQQRLDWNSRKKQVMLQVLAAKFEQNPHLKELLLATTDAYLVEHTPVKGRDAFWSDDSDGTGRNTLGKCLMKVRQHLGGTGIVSRPRNYNRFLSNRT